MNEYPLEIAGIGCYIPDKGRAPKNMPQSVLAKNAIDEALLDGNISIDDIDVILNASETIETFIPEGATLMQAALGWGSSGISCLTVQNGWNGFIQALESCICFGKNGRYQNVLVVISEIYSHIVDEHDPISSQYFKDSAVAVVIRLSPADDVKGYAFYPAIYNQSKTDVVKSLFSIGNIEAGKKGKELCISYKSNKLLEEAKEFLKTEVPKYIEKNGSADFVVAQYFGNEYTSALCSAFRGSKILNDERYAGFGTDEMPLNFWRAVKDGIIKSGNSVIICGTGSGICSAITKIVC